MTLPLSALRLLSSPALSAVKLSGTTLRKIGGGLSTLLLSRDRRRVEIARIATFSPAGRASGMRGKREQARNTTARYPPPGPRVVVVTVSAVT